MIVGFNLTTIAVHKKNPIRGKIKVSHDLHIDTLHQQQLPLKEKKSALVFDFTFTVDYQPHVGDLTLGGNVLYFHDDQKKIKNVFAQWEKTKKIPPEVSAEIVNAILAKCSVKALELANDLNLPAHLPLPKISLHEDPRQYIG